MITTWKADDGSIFFADGTWIRVGDRLKAEVVVSKHAAEVEARDEVITKLLAMLKAEHSRWIVKEPDGNHYIAQGEARLFHLKEWQCSELCSDHNSDIDRLHASACAIAGRTE